MSDGICKNCGAFAAQQVTCGGCLTKLEAENAALRSRLSAYEEGIRPEDADKEGIYVIKYRDHWIDVRYEHDGWYVFDQEFQEWAQVYPSRLYPLPQKEKS